MSQGTALFFHLPAKTDGKLHFFIDFHREMSYNILVYIVRVRANVIHVSKKRGVDINE